VRVVSFSTSEGRARDISADVAEELRRRCDLQMREVPANIQEFVQRYEAASPRQLTLRLPELVRIARGIDPGET
jgi:hypothetical protein